jgi:hypothetical protein
VRPDKIRELEELLLPDQPPMVDPEMAFVHYLPLLETKLFGLKDVDSFIDGLTSTAVDAIVGYEPYEVVYTRDDQCWRTITHMTLGEHPETSGR